MKESEVTVSKHVDTEHVRKDVPITRDEVTVERRPARPGMSTKPTIADDEIRVPVMSEEVVVEKRAGPMEEIVIERHAKHDTKTVEADLKRERVDVERTHDESKQEDRRP